MEVTWIRVANDLPDHPKSFLLSQDLKEPNAWGYIARLWMWCSKYSQSGRISGLVAPAAERAAGWTREPGGLMAAAERAGFLDPDNANAGWVCHDWDSQQGAPIEKAKKDAKRKKDAYEAARLAREKSENGAEKSRSLRDNGAESPGESPENGAPSRGYVTGRDGTGQVLLPKEVVGKQPAAPKTPGLVPVEAPTKPRETWGFVDFEQWAQFTRQAAGLAPQKSIPILEADPNWQAMTKWTEGEIQPICDAFIAFGEDDFWQKQKPPLPLRGFLSQWNDYMPMKGGKRAHG